MPTFREAHTEIVSTVIRDLPVQVKYLLSAMLNGEAMTEAETRLVERDDALHEMLRSMADAVIVYLVAKGD